MNNTSRASDPLPIESIKELGTGSYGCVYLVRVLTTKKLYAMKLLNLSPLSQNQKVSIQKEIEIMSNLRHNNVIRFKQAFLAKNSEIHIIMEYADLGDLSQAVKNLCPTNTNLQDWIYQLTCGLEFVHSKKIVHRDIKPSNIFLKSVCGCTQNCSRKSVKIGDFGVSTILHRDSEYKTATVIGTPYYLAPEICQGLKYDFKADVWSLGCVLYEVLTGRPPFLASSLDSLMQKILSGKYPSVPPDSDPVLSNLLTKLIQVKPDKRPSCVFLKHLLSLQMDRDAFHDCGQKLPESKEIKMKNENQGRETFVQKSARCFSAVENGVRTPKSNRALRRIQGNHNDSGYKSPVDMSPFPVLPDRSCQNNIGAECTWKKIDSLLTWLDASLGGALLAESIAIYRQTKSLQKLKRVLGETNVAFASSILQLVHLENKCFQAKQSSV